MDRLPNIVVCMCDQLRAFEVGCYGNTEVHTPHIDQLAREGVFFEHAVTNNPVCMPTRSSLLSGQYSRPTHLYAMQLGADLNSVTDDRLCFYDLRDDPYEQRNLAESLRQPALAQALREQLLLWHRNTP